MASLVVAEHNNSALNEATAKTITAAAAVSKPVHVLVAGQNCRAAAEKARAISGVEKVLLADDARYASLPNIMKARKKPIAEKSVSDFGIDPAPRLKVLEVTPPEKRRSGERVASVGELVGKLRERGVI